MNGRKGNKFLLTQSLLSSWQYALKSGEWGELLSTLRREKKPQSKAMLDGIRFENVVGKQGCLPNTSFRKLLSRDLTWLKSRRKKSNDRQA